MYPFVRAILREHYSSNGGRCAHGLTEGRLTGQLQALNRSKSTNGREGNFHNRPAVARRSCAWQRWAGMVQHAQHATAQFAQHSRDQSTHARVWALARRWTAQDGTGPALR